nr:LD09837p [Drosophila melanogaster]
MFVCAPNSLTRLIFENFLKYCHLTFDIPQTFLPILERAEAVFRFCGERVAQRPWL